jgi:predicted nucleic acid-binding protein
VKTLVDTNVLLDIITHDPKWSSWAETALRAAAERSTLAINPIVFAEVSMKFDRIDYADDPLVISGVRRARAPVVAIP